MNTITQTTKGLLGIAGLLLMPSTGFSFCENGTTHSFKANNVVVATATSTDLNALNFSSTPYTTLQEVPVLHSGLTYEIIDSFDAGCEKAATTAKMIKNNGTNTLNQVQDSTLYMQITTSYNLQGVDGDWLRFNADSSNWTQENNKVDLIMQPNDAANGYYFFQGFTKRTSEEGNISLLRTENLDSANLVASIKNTWAGASASYPNATYEIQVVRIDYGFADPNQSSESTPSSSSQTPSSSSVSTTPDCSEGYARNFQIENGIDYRYEGTIAGSPSSVSATPFMALSEVEVISNNLEYKVFAGFGFNCSWQKVVADIGYHKGVLGNTLENDTLSLYTLASDNYLEGWEDFHFARILPDTTNLANRPLYSDELFLHKDERGSFWYGYGKLNGATTSIKGYDSTLVMNNLIDAVSDELGYVFQIIKVNYASNLATGLSSSSTIESSSSTIESSSSESTTLAQFKGEEWNLAETNTHWIIPNKKRQGISLYNITGSKILEIHSENESISIPKSSITTGKYLLKSGDQITPIYKK